MQGGVKLGTWFVREGTLGFDYPDWMKYLGFYLDFKVHRLVYERALGSGAVAGSGAVSGTFLLDDEITVPYSVVENDRPR